MLWQTAREVSFLNPSVSFSFVLLWGGVIIVEKLLLSWKEKIQVDSHRLALIEILLEERVNCINNELDAGIVVEPGGNKQRKRSGNTKTYTESEWFISFGQSFRTSHMKRGKQWWWESSWPDILTVSLRIWRTWHIFSLVSYWAQHLNESAQVLIIPMAVNQMQIAAADREFQGVSGGKERHKQAEQTETRSKDSGSTTKQSEPIRFDKNLLHVLPNRKHLLSRSVKFSVQVCVPSPLCTGGYFHAHLPVPAAERISGKHAVVTGSVPLTGRHRHLHDSRARADVDTPLQSKNINDSSSLGVFAGNFLYSLWPLKSNNYSRIHKYTYTYQSRGYDYALYRLRFIKQLQLLDDVHFSFDVDSSVQPAVVCKHRNKPVKGNAPITFRVDREYKLQLVFRRGEMYLIVFLSVNKSHEKDQNQQWVLPSLGAFWFPDAACVSQHWKNVFIRGKTHLFPKTAGLFSVQPTPIKQEVIVHLLGTIFSGGLILYFVFSTVKWEGYIRETMSAGSVHGCF